MHDVLSHEIYRALLKNNKNIQESVREWNMVHFFKGWYNMIYITFERVLKYEIYGILEVLTWAIAHIL